MRTAMLFMAMSAVVFASTGCLKDKCPGCTKDEVSCQTNADCVSPAVCLDGQCRNLKEYCAATGICGLAVAECKCDGNTPTVCRACDPKLSCPAPVCPTIPTPVVNCPDLPTPVCSCPAPPTCPSLACPPIPDCKPSLYCPPAPACPRAPDCVLVTPECKDCSCKDGVTNLTLTYNGTTGATVTVTNYSGTLFTGHVNSGGSFSFTGLGTDQLMHGQITVKTCKDSTGGGVTVMCPSTCPTTTIVTDCSKAIAVGSVFGDYAVLDGSSRTNGKFCAPDAGGAVP